MPQDWANEDWANLDDDVSEEEAEDDDLGQAEEPHSRSRRLWLDETRSVNIDTAAMWNFTSLVVRWEEAIPNLLITQLCNGLASMKLQKWKSNSL